MKRSNDKKRASSVGPTAGTRAMIETIKAHRLEGWDLLAFSILCECCGDWDSVETFFHRPKVVAQGGWASIRTLMNSRRETLDELFLEATARLALSTVMPSQPGCD